MKHIKLFEEYSFAVDDVNKIVYGNPTKDKYEIAYETESPIKDWFISEGIANDIIANSPLNNSSTTKKDLQSLSSNKITAEDLSFARYVDDVSNMAQTYIDLLQEKGIEMTMGEFFSIDSQLEPLIFWLKDKSLTDLDNLPDPEILASEIIENLEAALANFKNVSISLN